MKLYVASDLHGFYTEFKQALEKTNFEINNENHLLIVCGDLFDRGKEALKLWSYLNSIPNKVLIKGNHEELMLDMIDRGYALSHDISNGTWNTAEQLGYNPIYADVDLNKVESLFNIIIPQMKDYFETKNYIFVHAWIPIICKDNLPAYYTRNRKFEYDPNWRVGNWKDARWGNPFELFKQGLNQTEKTIVFGHWHTSAGYHMFQGIEEFGPYAIFEPFKKDNIIGIDACTAYSGKVNILELEDDLLDRN